LAGKFVLFVDGVKVSEDRSIDLRAGTNVTLTASDTQTSAPQVTIAASGGGGGAVATDTIWDAKGDLAAGTGADTASRLAVGANDTILMADSAEATGLKWAAAATTAQIADVSNAEAAGTSDTYARGDHVHAHEAAHVAHDTIFDAKGDLVAGTAADTASRLAVGTDDSILMADAAQATGLKWAAAATTAEIADVSNTEAAGTSDTYARGDHVHAHEAAHLAHDTLWDAKGDLVVGTAADTAARLAAGTVGSILASDTTDGVQWVPPWWKMSFPTDALAETIPRHIADGAALTELVSGRLSLHAIYLPDNLTITSISYMSGTGATSPTNQWFALYDSALNLLRQTTDDTTTAWGANTLKTLNLTSTYTTTAAGLYYVGVCVAASTVPQLRGDTKNASNLNAIAPILHGTSTTGLTDTAPNPAGALTATSRVIYAYLK
jgi:hypothetical protein